MWFRVFIISCTVSLGIFGMFNYVKSNTDFLAVNMSVSGKASELKPDEPVRIVFSKPVIAEKTAASLKVEPNVGYQLKWSEDKRELLIYPKSLWENGSEYHLFVNGGKSFLGIEFSGQVSFSTEDFPTVLSISPIDGEKDVIVDMEDPIIVNFNKPTNDYDVKIKFNQIGELAYEINESKNSIKILPKEKLESGKRHDVFVEIKHKDASEEKYREIFHSYFETKRIIIEEWSKDTTIRLYEAKNYTVPKIETGKYIDINLKSQVMVIFENGQALDSYLISSGKQGMNTPEGTFQIYNKHPRPWSKKYSLFMPFWMAITSSGEFGIHELPEWPGGYKEGANHLGIPVSHGCVRLGVGPAERVYNWAEIGIPVVVHY